MNAFARKARKMGRYEEQLNLSDFERGPYELRSLIVPGLMVKRDACMGCPRCKEEIPKLEHNKETQCKYCNLGMRAVANALYIWEEE